MLQNVISAGAPLKNEDDKVYTVGYSRCNHRVFDADYAVSLGKSDNTHKHQKNLKLYMKSSGMLSLTQKVRNYGSVKRTNVKWAKFIEQYCMIIQIIQQP